MRHPLLSELRTLLGEHAVVTAGEALEGYRHDESRQVRGGAPLAAVLPASAEQLATVVGLAAAHGVPVVPRGAGTGLSGGAAAVDGCVVVSTTRMSAIVSIDVNEQYAVVQPGVITADLDAAAAGHGLCYPPDPSSWRECTLGGNIATDAGGLCCVRYGTTSDHVLALQVVLADGSVLRTGRRTAKGVAGYDLTRLFTGSEGTLGIVTEATLRLRPRRPEPATVVALFPSLTAAGAAVVAILRAGLTTSLLEIMDRTTLDAVEQLAHMGLDPAASALVVTQTEAVSDAPAVQSICASAGASETHATADATESELLLQARRLALPALQRLGSVLLDDVAVPRNAIPELIAQIAGIARAAQLVIGTFGHAGDGNLHPTIVYDATDEREVTAAQQAFDGVLAAALALGGTITGEHGVGRLKASWLRTEVGDTSVRVQSAIKTALDPLHLMNPGAVLTSDGYPYLLR